MHKCQMIYMMTVRKILSSLDGSNYSTHTHIPSKLMCYESWPTNQHWLNRYGSSSSSSKSRGRAVSELRGASKAFSLIVRGCLATTILTFQNMAAHKKNSTNHDSHILEHRPTPETSYTSTSFYVVTHYKSKSSYTILACVYSREKKGGNSH